MAAAVLVATLAAAPTVSAEIFKCNEKNGLVRYQNFPCPIDSLGSLPAGATQPAKATPPASAQKGAAAPVRSSRNEPGVGMTPEEVREIWGEPSEVVQDEPRGGRVEIWEYGDGRSVRFDASKHRVLSVQR